LTGPKEMKLSTYFNGFPKTDNESSQYANDNANNLAPTTTTTTKRKKGKTAKRDSIFEILTLHRLRSH